jgi:hypothetical protein
MTRAGADGDPANHPTDRPRRLGGTPHLTARFALQVASYGASQALVTAWRHTKPADRTGVIAGKRSRPSARERRVAVAGVIESFGALRKEFDDAPRGRAVCPPVRPAPLPEPISEMGDGEVVTRHRQRLSTHLRHLAQPLSARGRRPPHTGTVAEHRALRVDRPADRTGGRRTVQGNQPVRTATSGLNPPLVVVADPGREFAFRRRAPFAGALEAGLVEVATQPHVLMVHELELVRQLLLDAHLEKVKRSGLVPAGRVDAWLADLIAASERGTFLYGLTAFMVVGRKPVAP